MRRNWFRHRVWWDEEGLEARGDAKGDPAKPRADDPERLADYCERWLIVTRSTVACMMSGELYADASVRYDKATVDKVAAALALGRAGRRAVDRGHIT